MEPFIQGKLFFIDYTNSLHIPTGGQPVRGLLDKAYNHSQLRFQWKNAGLTGIDNCSS